MAPFAALADEQDKAELVKKLEGMEQRIRELEQEQVRMQRSLDEPYISASEPEVSARLKAVESQVYSYRQAARTIESLEGISADAGLTMMAQGLNKQKQRAQLPR